MSDDAKYYYVTKFNLELAIDEAVSEIIQASQGDREWSGDSGRNDIETESPITLFSSSTAADKSKSVISQKAPEEEMDISFTEEDQLAPQLHITKVDQPKTDSSTKKDKKKRKKKKSRQNQSQEADQMTKPIPSSSSLNPPILEESPPPLFSTLEKGKTLGRKDKLTDIYVEQLRHPAALIVMSRVISIQVKRQKKYKTVRCKFEMNELFMEYNTNKSWMAPLNALPVRWFPALWSLKERKERERYQVVIEQPPEDMNTTTLALKENISSLIQRDIRMFKEVKLPDGSRKIIGYLSTWDNMKECIDTPMVWNGARLK
ncbi:hypothetical protein GLOIN_2v1473242 [Rhizophagus clarus]|uniref:Uncharacterized protein n=1 Tax=Rhizophagus clarus TaxID=94130 RepID=A0A8H3LLQ7_9GLOM|nr:hypothetical protein GLOIN_2v1473242 [Rhizophagus clarus]